MTPSKAPEARGPAIRTAQPVTAQDGLVDRIYEASVVPELWEAVLADIASFSGTAWSTLAAVRDGAPRWISSLPAADDAVRAHFERFSDNRRTSRLLARQHPGFITDYDLLTQEEIDREPVYQDFLIPNGYGFGVATTILPPTGEVIAVHCEGHFSRGRIGHMTVERLDRLRPHLARAAVLSTRLSFERTRTAVDTLSALSIAACAVLENGAVLVGNAEFNAERALWTTRGNDRIALADKAAGELLAEALSGLRVGAGVRSIALRAAPGGQPAVLHVVPIQRSARDLFSRAAAILFVTRAVAALTDTTPLLQALFDLTTAEAQVAARVAAGQAVEDIARADGKSALTLRNQLRSVMQKTGCRRQVDLVRLLTQLMPGR